MRKRGCFDNSLFFWYNKDQMCSRKEEPAMSEWTENRKIEVLGIALENYSTDQAMEQIESYLDNERMNTIGIVTMQMLILAGKDPKWKAYLEDLDLRLIGETEILDAAGVEPETPAYEEIDNNELLARMFWYFIQKNCSVFVLGDTDEEAELLAGYLADTYPGSIICGSGAAGSLDEAGADNLINEINSQAADVIVSGLAGTVQNRFVMENRSKMTAKIWLSLGEHPSLQSEAGIKTSWWGTLLKKNVFRRMVAKYNSKKEESI